MHDTMNRKQKLVLYGILLALGVLTFVLEIFVFQKPSGVLGFLICMASIYLSLGSMIKLAILSEHFKEGLLNFIDLLFWLP